MSYVQLVINSKLILWKSFRSA